MLINDYVYKVGKTIMYAGSKRIIWLTASDFVCDYVVSELLLNASSIDFIMKTKYNLNDKQSFVKCLFILMLISSLMFTFNNILQNAE